MATEDARKLFVAGLPDSVTEEVLRGLFSETGAQVTELTLPRDRTTGRPRGFAFVRLGSTDEAERARQELDGRIVDGKMISVRPFQAEPPAGRAAMGPREGGGMDRPPRREGGFGPGPGPGAGPGGPPGGGGGFGGGGGGPGGSPDRTLYVGNLPYDATQEEIETLLRECGTEPVVRVYLPLDQDGRKRGFGFVTLGSAEVATAAIDQLKNAELRGRRLIINIAHPKGARPEGASSGPPGGFADRPRSFGGPPGGGFSGPPGGGPGFGGPPAPGGPPAARAGKGEGRKRKFDGPGGEGGGEKAAAGGKKREKEERWRDQEDDDW